jgi:hypothetical protein
VPLNVASVHPGVPCALTGATATSPGRCSGGANGDDKYHPFSLAANEPVRVTFTQPATPASITHGAECNTGSVRIEQIDASGACTAAVAGTLVHHDRVLSFVPDAPWQTGTHYRLTLVSGTNATCDPGEICGISGAASFDPVAGSGGGGPNLVIDFTGTAATDATLMNTATSPLSDTNGSGALESGEVASDDNRVALRIASTGGIVSSATFGGPDCVPSTPQQEACMYLSGALPVELQPVAHDCPLPGGQTAASCIPVVLSPQLMFATSVSLSATAVIAISTETKLSVMRLREPAGGPITGYIIDDGGTPTLVAALDLYLDAPDMSIPLSTHDLHSKPLSITLRGPVRFSADGRISIAATNVADVPVTVNIAAAGLAPGSVNMVIPSGQMKLQLLSPPLRGGLP